MRALDRARVLHAPRGALTHARLPRAPSARSARVLQPKLRYVPKEEPYPVGSAVELFDEGQQKYVLGTVQARREGQWEENWRRARGWTVRPPPIPTE